MGRLEQLSKAARMAVRNGGGPAVLDRFNNPIPVGGMVIYHPPVDLVYQVVDVRPVMDPRAPKGLATVTLQVQFPIQVPFGHPNMQLLCIAGPQPIAGAEGTDAATDDTNPPADGEQDAPASPGVSDRGGSQDGPVSRLVNSAGQPLEPLT